MTTAPNTTDRPWTIGRLLSWTADYFDQQGVDDSRLSAEVLLAHVLACSRIDLYTRFNVTPDEETTQRFRRLVKRAADHEPIAYLVGQKEFFSLPFYVTPDVLIPRGETETLVECVIDYCRAHDARDTASTPRPAPTGSAGDSRAVDRDRSGALGFPTILDVGTGSGCIAIAILTQIEDATAVATDVSSAALAVAKRNAERHDVLARITFVEANRLTFSAGAIPDGRFDVLVSNPPYVSARDVPDLDSTVRDYEPHTALTDGHDGLSFYKTIARDASGILRPGGIVFVEIGDGQERAVRDTMTAGGVWEHRGSYRDAITEKPRVLSFISRGRH